MPIYYGSRLAKLALGEAKRPMIDPDFEEIPESEEIERKEKLKTKWAQLEAIVGAHKRLRDIAQDIVEHLEKRLEAMAIAAAVGSGEGAGCALQSTDAKPPMEAGSVAAACQAAGDTTGSGAAVRQLARRAPGSTSRAEETARSLPSEGRLTTPRDYRTWRLAKMNLAIRSFDSQITHGDTLHDDRFPDRKADFAPANSPFNVSGRGGEHLGFEPGRVVHARLRTRIRLLLIVYEPWGLDRQAIGPTFK